MDTGTHNNKVHTFSRTFNHDENEWKILRFNYGSLLSKFLSVHSFSNKFSSDSYSIETTQALGHPASFENIHSPTQQKLAPWICHIHKDITASTWLLRALHLPWGRPMNQVSIIFHTRCQWAQPGLLASYEVALLFNEFRIIHCTYTKGTIVLSSYLPYGFITLKIKCPIQQSYRDMIVMLTRQASFLVNTLQQ